MHIVLSGRTAILIGLSWFAKKICQSSMAIDKLRVVISHAGLNPPYNFTSDQRGDPEFQWRRVVAPMP